MRRTARRADGSAEVGAGSGAKGSAETEPGAWSGTNRSAETGAKPNARSANVLLLLLLRQTQETLVASALPL